jgi:trehalose utilization protein
VDSPADLPGGLFCCPIFAIALSSPRFAAGFFAGGFMPIRVTVWNENIHEKKDPRVAKLYPLGIHGTLAAYLKKSKDLKVRTATMDQPDHGLGPDVLDNTDVLTWWAHHGHRLVDDAIVQKVHERVLAGMGILILHSAHFSKIFKLLMGTTCNLKWRHVDNEREIMWVTRPGHPIVRDIDDHFIIDHEEMYGEFFDIPEPDCTFLISSFSGGEVFRSGCTWTRGAGKVVYFRPGHETFPSYYNTDVLKVIENAVRWLAPAKQKAPHTFGNRKMGWMDQDRR